MCKPFILTAQLVQCKPWATLISIQTIKPAINRIVWFKQRAVHINRSSNTINLHWMQPIISSAHHAADCENRVQLQHAALDHTQPPTVCTGHFALTQHRVPHSCITLAKRINTCAINLIELNWFSSSLADKIMVFQSWSSHSDWNRHTRSVKTLCLAH